MLRAGYLFTTLAQQMIAQLIPNDGTAPITLNRNLTIVGRKASLCDLVIESASISKIHCAIAKTDGLLFIRDLGSTNGTKVNGQRVTRGALLPGDELAFANTCYRVHLGPSEGQNPEQTEPLQVIPEVNPVESDGELVGVDSETGLPFISEDDSFEE